jgi:polyhydroxyalkanoic acid synthase PhaR subunit
MSEPTNPFDPFEAWRKMQEANMDAWSKSMVQAVNTESYAKATGALLDAYLAASGPFREALEKTMRQALQQLSIPTRDDFISLAERMTNIELRLDDMDAKLDRIESLSAAAKLPEKK